MNQMMQLLMTRLQNKNPQGYKTINELMRNNGNPRMILQQMLGGATPEQKQSLLNQAKSYGVPNNILSEIQNMK